MTTYDMSTRATIARDGDDTYFLTVRTLQNASEDIFVTANLTGENVKTIAGWANASKATLCTYPVLPTVRAGLIELTLYTDNSIGVTVSNWESTVSWQLTETASQQLIEEAGRWTR